MKLRCKLRQAGVWQRSTGPLHGSGFESSKVFYTGKGRNCVQFLPLVGVAGFEPAASWTRTKRDTKLRHTPIASLLYSIIGSVSSLLTENCGAEKFWGSLRKTAGGCEIARGGGMFLDDLARLCYNRIGSRHLSRRCPAARDGRRIGEK